MDTMFRDMMLWMCASVYLGIAGYKLSVLFVKRLVGQIYLKEEISKRNTLGIIILIIKGILLLPGTPMAILMIILCGLYAAAYTINNKLNHIGMKPVDGEDDMDYEEDTPL